METKRYYFQEVYYSDVDLPNEELELFGGFLKNNTGVNRLYLASFTSETPNLKLKKYNKDYRELLDYAFITGAMAGVGIYNFIIECAESANFDSISKLFSKISSKSYLNDDWIGDLMGLDGVITILKTDCDGVWVDIWRKSDA
jgi:hypothetical protein